MSPDFNETQAPDELDHGITLSVNILIEADHSVYDLSEAKAILGKAKKIVVGDCPCRIEHHNCDAPLDVCLSLDDQADISLRNGGNNREVTIDDALSILKRSHEAGLVHMAYVAKGADKPKILCSCCACCCNTLRPMIEKDTFELILSSKKIAEDEHKKCIACGVCVQRCMFGARKLKDGELIYDPSRCMGCGVCVSTCPSETISMVPRRAFNGVT
ncbi:MAG: 4Fe-4S dicluster domain-containing protein [Candidatus Bathyarchaeota archaeon]|nr:4Fe-4S dicluster domain-containing protein [Candidatus Bathyarchaeota archaeon]